MGLQQSCNLTISGNPSPKIIYNTFFVGKMYAGNGIMSFQEYTTDMKH